MMGESRFPGEWEEHVREDLGDLTIEGSNMAELAHG
jgi:hypothetical protein